MSGRLLFVVNIPRFFVSHRLPLAIAARDAGFEVHVATASGDPENTAVIRDHGFIHHPLPLDQHGRRPHRELRSMLTLIGLLGRLRPDLVHLVTIKPVLYGGIAARLTQRRAVVAAMSGLGRTFRDEQGGVRPPSRSLRAAFRLALPPRTTHLLLQNVDDLAALRTAGIAREGHASVIAGSGVDLAAFHPPADIRPHDRPVTFLYAGRLMRQKGVAAFVAAAQRLEGRGRFLIAGYAEESSPDAVPISQVERWAAEGLVEWLGARTDMPGLLREVDVVVLPTVYGEGVPRILIEAAASGRALIASDAPGCRDVCRDGINGMLVPPGDADALVHAMEAFIADPEVLGPMGRAGRRLAEEHFGAELILAQTLALYDRILAAGR